MKKAPELVWYNKYIPKRYKLELLIISEFFDLIPLETLLIWHLIAATRTCSFKTHSTTYLPIFSEIGEEITAISVIFVKISFQTHKCRYSLYVSDSGN